MSQDCYTKDITAENLRAFLELWAWLPSGIEEAMQIIIESNDLFFDKDADSFSWCHLYELPIQQHIDFSFPGLLPENKAIEWRKQVAESPGKIAALPNVCEQINDHFTARADPTEEDIKALSPYFKDFCAYFYSTQYSLLCLRYHGCYMNDLIAHVRTGNNKALFDAIRIDSTVIGCQSVIQRISQAKRLQDDDFLSKFKNAMNGKNAKREQANFQQMRIVLKVLSEAGAVRLTNEQLHRLFVEDLNLYTANSKGGGSEKALRKFVDTYMKQNATT